MTPNQNASRIIAGLLHQTRSASWDSNQTLELSAAMKNQPAEILALALLEFSAGLLNASRQVVTIQLNAAIVDQAMDERDAGGALQ